MQVACIQEAHRLAKQRPSLETEATGTRTTGTEQSGLSYHSLDGRPVRHQFCDDLPALNLNELFDEVQQQMLRIIDEDKNVPEVVTAQEREPDSQASDMVLMQESADSEDQQKIQAKRTKRTLAISATWRAPAPLAVIRGHEHPEHALSQCSFLLLIINVPLLICSRALFFGPALPSLGGSRARFPFIRVTPNFGVPSAGSGVSWLTPQPTRELRRPASCERRDSWRAIEGNRPKGQTIVWYKIQVNFLPLMLKAQKCRS